MDIRNFAIKALSTFFYIGYLPLIPGTFGSLAGLGIFYLIKGNSFVYILSTVSLTALGFLITAQAERVFNKKDARCIVIDEVSGMLLSLAFIPYSLKLAVIGFIIFRILDALKPFPAGRVENFQGSSGIMGDDIIAGLYTNIILQVLLRVVSFRIS